MREFIKRFFSSPISSESGYWVDVRCQRCGELLRARVDLRHELSQVDSPGEGRAYYFCRKVLIGAQRCYQPIEVELFFDANRNLVTRKISGGEFVDR